MNQIQTMLQALKQWRQARGISIVEMEKECGMSASQISHIESGRTNIRLLTFLRYLDAAGFKIRFMFKTKDGNEKKVMEV